MRDTGPKRHFYDSIPFQTLIALSFNNISLFAGGLISLFTPQFQEAPWILALFPPILTIRGGIGGLFSGNLATMLHLGLIKPQIRGNTRVYWQLISASYVITVIDTVIMGLFAFILNFALGRATLEQFYVFAVVPPVACVMALALSIPLTSIIAIVSFKRGLDPDILVYPILASINDIVVTAAFVTAILMVLSGGVFNYLLPVLFLLIGGIAFYIAWKNRRIKFFYQTIREGTAIVILSSIFGSINGMFLSSMGARLQAHPGLVVLYPALTNALGNIGSIIGSTKTTSLALGYMRSFNEEVRSAVSSILQVEAVAFGIHIIFGFVAYLIVSPASPGVSLMFLVSVAVTTNIATFLVIGFFALIIAYFSFRRGLNPDNIVIPAITTASDSVVTIAVTPVIFVLKLFGVK
ncbi:magnesium transporter [Candidatus Bathyarchaeota archaeon]|nr:magnesium transporter [Candidatus Bathyarchaeota archaeon]MBL7080394.1 magnesium transporter [Candidatus Bathyarchaeota archaeon]